MNIIIALFFSWNALATTFGPIALVTQAENSQYIVEGRVHGSSVRQEPNSNLPYTYYQFTLVSQHKGQPLPQEFLIRSPGGEIADKGYQVAGAVSFSNPEDVVVHLKDSNEADVKEVVGLASGKYTETQDVSGKKVLTNGLGFPVTGASGERLTAPDFLALIDRAVAGQASSADQSIMLNVGTGHDDTNPAPSTNANTLAPTATTPITNTKSVKLSSTSAEKKTLGSSGMHWQIGLRLAFLAVITVALIVYFRRMRD